MHRIQGLARLIFVLVLIELGAAVALAVGGGGQRIITIFYANPSYTYVVGVRIGGCGSSGGWGAVSPFYRQSVHNCPG